MQPDASIRFFETQFQRQVQEQERTLNPFEQAAVPFLKGRVLDYGCGLGNLSLVAARRACSVLALDASPTAIEHLRAVAQSEALDLVAEEADLRTYVVQDRFDTIVCIGLLMFFDCPTAFDQLKMLQERLRPGGIAIVNVLIEGTTYQEMFDPSGHCLFSRGELESRFAGWQLLHVEHRDFPAPGEKVKSFATVIASRPAH